MKLPKLISTRKCDNKITLTEEVYKNLENNINKFLDDRKIRIYYEKHFDQNIKNLYAFIPNSKKIRKT